jgi:hypothetical protein
MDQHNSTIRELLDDADILRRDAELRMKATTSESYCLVVVAALSSKKR